MDWMLERFSTSYSYSQWLQNWILPKWGNNRITDLQAMEVQRWLRTLALAPKSKVHIRGLIRRLWDYAIWSRTIPEQRNPMDQMTIRDATNRRKPRSLTEDEFHRFIVHLEEPIKTVALACVSFGLRISEALALKWGDVDWTAARLTVERGIVRQRLGPVKTKESERKMAIDPALLVQLQHWRNNSQFPRGEDWVFASPVKMGRLPISYPWVWKAFRHAAKAAGIETFGTHTMRHTYTSWLDAAWAPLSVQQKLMRHADIRTTMNVYGDVVTDEMSHAHSKVVEMALGRVN
jgi:integrase